MSKKNRNWPLTLFFLLHSVLNNMWLMFCGSKVTWYFCQHTTQSEQWRELSAVMNSRWISCTGHPQVFIYGGGGDDVPIDGGGPPVTVGQGDPHHHPSSKSQNQSHYFHNWIHDLSLVQQLTRSIDPDFCFSLSETCLKSQNIWFCPDRKSAKRCVVWSVAVGCL